MWMVHGDFSRAVMMLGWECRGRMLGTLAGRSLVNFIQDLLTGQRRLFAVDGQLSASWHDVSRGLAQGDPLSPLLAASMMWVWASTVSRTGAEAATFVDDRSFWSTSLRGLLDAHGASHRVDTAFGLRCDCRLCLRYFLHNTGCDL